VKPHVDSSKIFSNIDSKSTIIISSENPEQETFIEFGGIINLYHVSPTIIAIANESSVYIQELEDKPNIFTKYIIPTKSKKYFFPTKMKEIFGYKGGEKSMIFSLIENNFINGKLYIMNETKLEMYDIITGYMEKSFKFFTPIKIQNSNIRIPLITHSNKWGLLAMAYDN